MIVFELDSAAAIKAWETRRANGFVAKGKAKSVASGDDSDRDWDHTDVVAIGHAAEKIEANIVDQYVKSGGQDYDRAHVMKYMIAQSLGPAIETAVGKENLQAASIGLGLGTGSWKQDPANVASSLISEWASSSGGSNPTSVTMQMLAKDEFGLTDAKTNMGWEKVRITREDVADKAYDEGQKSGRAFLRAMYDKTQATFKEQGITHVTLYRGTKLDFDKIEHGSATVRTQPMSSWTYDFSTAKDFSKGVILGIRVPVSKVIGSYLTGYGCRGEKEVVLLGGEYKVKASRGGEGGLGWKGLPKNGVDFQQRVNAAKASKPVESSPAKVEPAGYSGMTPGQKAAATKKANAAKKNLSDVFEDDDDLGDVIDIDEDLDEADWPKVAGDKGEAPRSLAYRDRLTLLLERDQSAAAKKAWESRQRKSDGGSSSKSDASTTSTTSTTATLRPATADDADRIKALKLPPAWTDVHLNEDPDGALVATGIDAKGRTQYRYSAEHSQSKAAEKFARVKEFHEALPNLRQTIATDLKRGSPDREAASVLYLIDKTGFRIGSDEDTKADTKAFGASTLQSKHVKVDGNTVKFSFTGKKGVAITKSVEDATLAKMMTQRVKAGGQLFSATDGQVRTYLKAKAGDFKVKDFRTYHGTAVALKAMKGMTKPTSESAFKKAQREVSKVVADFLGNTPTVAKSSYIDPAVWGRWQTKPKKKT